MRDIFFVIGTRAEAIKIMPVCKALDEMKVPYSVISTGQHELSEFKFKRFTEVIRAKGKAGNFNNIIEALPFLIRAMARILPKIKGQIVVVHGDTMTTAAGAITGVFGGAIVCHLESGLRTGDIFNPFPEEISRIIADKASQVHFAPTQRAAKVTSGQTYLVGNTVIDSIKARKLKIKDESFIIVSVHRQENIKNKRIMEKIVEKVVEETRKRKVVWVLSQNTERKLKQYGLYEKIRKHCTVINLMPYEGFVKFLARCKAVLSDSGGLAEECSYLHKPLIILREKTERQESIENEYALLGFEFDLDRFIEGFKPKKKNIYGDGTAGKKVAAILKKLRKR